MLPRADSSWSFPEAAHLLNRAGFGGSPEEIRAFHRLGREMAVKSLFEAVDSAGTFPAPEWTAPDEAEANAREFLALRRALQQQTAGTSVEEREAKRREFARQGRLVRRARALEIRNGWFLRMLQTRAPLREKMTLFWHDHFATSMQKVDHPLFIFRQNELFRQHAFGNFRKLTGRILRDPAMMLYLDTQSSKKDKPNENFAREVMELFTLGEGQYTEQDIREAARALTGYRLNRVTGAVFRDRRQADTGEKTIFGKTGAYDGESLVDLIFEKPRAAEFIVRKLWEYFVYEDPAEKVIVSLAETLRSADFEISAVLREIFLAREFYSARAIRTQIKCPVQFLIGLLKQCGMRVPPPGLAVAAGQQLGQVLFQPPNVAGWDWGKAWINTNTLLTRYNIAGYVTKGNDETFRPAGMKKNSARRAKRRNEDFAGPDYEVIAPRPSRKNPEELVAMLTARFFQGSVPPRAKESFIAYAKEKQGVIFTNREVAELIHLMLSTPYYQLC